MSAVTQPLSLIEQIAQANRDELAVLLKRVITSKDLVQEDPLTGTAALDLDTAVKILPVIELLKQVNDDRYKRQHVRSALTIDELEKLGIEPDLANVALFGILFLDALITRHVIGKRLPRVNIARKSEDPLGDWQMDDLRVPSDVEH